MNKAAIELKDVACTFVSDDSGERTVYTAVKGVNLTVADGEFVSVGPTTLTHITCAAVICFRPTVLCRGKALWTM